jgi:hypothetical protein
MKTLLPALIAVSAMLPGTAPSQSKAPSKGRTRQVFVGVVDQASGAPVLDLAAKDFEVTEAGVKREILRAGLATNPMRVVLLVDTSDAANAGLTHIRAALLEFLNALPPEHEVMLVTTGRQMRVRVQPTMDRKKLKDTANGLFPDGAGTVLIDSLLEIDDRFIRKADDRWPVFVLVTTDGTESSAGAHEKEFNQWVQGLPVRGASVHAFVLKLKPGGPAQGAGSPGLPEIIAMNLTQNTGGRYDVSNTSNSLPEKLKALAGQMAADAKQLSTKYQVEYTTDSPTASPGLEIAVARAGVRIQMSYQRR